MTLPAVTSRGRNLALLAALLGWMFDGMEMALFPIVGRSALGELLRSAGDKETVNRWYGVILASFLVGAATGGVLFGWLGDKIGRVRALTVSVLVYSLCSGLSAMSQEVWHLGLLRFFGALGMGGEWALGVALVMELWPNTSRAWLAGWIGAFGNFGYLICGAIALGLNHTDPEALPRTLISMGLPNDWAAALTANRNWRLLMLVGAIPALLTVFLRMMVPESEKWAKEKEAGRASHWSERDLLGVLVGAVAALGVIALWALRPGELALSVRVAGSLAGLVVVVLGYMYPVRGYLARSALPVEARRLTVRRMLLAAALSGVPLLGTWAGLMWMYMWVDVLPGGTDKDAKAWMQIASSVGAAIGCVAAAVLGDYFGRRPVYAALCVISLVAMVLFYQQGRFYAPENGIGLIGEAVTGRPHPGGVPPYNTLFVLFAGLLGLVSAAFYGWLPLYLPELFPTAVRATGQGFGYNFGRIIAAVGQLQMANLLAAFGNDYAQACAVVAGVYLAGLVLIAIAPETKGQPLPE